MFDVSGFDTLSR